MEDLNRQFRKIKTRFSAHQTFGLHIDVQTALYCMYAHDGLLFAGTLHHILIYEIDTIEQRGKFSGYTNL
jgi:hypothetical protein